MSECTDTTEELVEEMRRIGRGLRTNRHPTYDFAGSLFWVADRMESLEAELRTLRADKERLEKGILFLCREGLDDCWVEHELNICMDSAVSDNEWLAAVEGFAKGTT